VSADPLPVLPHSLEAERAVLGCILQENDAACAFDLLTPDEFFQHQNQVIARVMMRMRSKDKPIDLVVLVEELERSGRLGD